MEEYGGAVDVGGKKEDIAVSGSVMSRYSPGLKERRPRTTARRALADEEGQALL